MSRHLQAKKTNLLTDKNRISSNFKLICNIFTLLRLYFQNYLNLPVLIMPFWFHLYINKHRHQLHAGDIHSWFAIFEPYYHIVGQNFL